MERYTRNRLGHRARELLMLPQADTHGDLHERMAADVRLLRTKPERAPPAKATSSWDEPSIGDNIFSRPDTHVPAERYTCNEL